MKPYLKAGMSLFSLWVAKRRITGLEQKDKSGIGLRSWTDSGLTIDRQCRPTPGRCLIDVLGNVNEADIPILGLRRPDVRMQSRQLLLFLSTQIMITGADYWLIKSSCEVPCTVPILPYCMFCKIIHFYIDNHVRLSICRLWLFQHSKLAL